MTIKQFINKVFLGDSRQILPTLPKNSIDLILTSPPYDALRDYKGGSWNFEIFQDIARELYRVLKPGGVIVWIVGDQTIHSNKTLTSFRQALFFQSLGLKAYDIMIYEKSGTGPPHKKRYFNAFEYMFIFTKGVPNTVHLLTDKKNKWGGYTTFSDVTKREKDGSLTNKGKKKIQEFGVRTNIWKYINGKGFSSKDKIAYKHPAIFPEKLAEDHILSWSNPGDVVLDPFAGSGTTLKKACELGRKWIGIEVSSEYISIIDERLKNVSNDNY